ncbi:hypothetical protein BU25DRAFT_479481 [Macroventuria anomochaeta]|uniref:Uncharacterized protein n=1 Tax=Macroventuria anomochaeta TaxID=301207 RepID=A0ACB6RPV1_9PLEO|nr:uncharacterized protein BU25DRAFT_479481 [Macroventuria anomochaeta]KAF2622944.1 hypothetical protein BU25DRAFT_479481 [Macroventuria anomochaeta]
MSRRPVTQDSLRMLPSLLSDNDDDKIVVVCSKRVTVEPVRAEVSEPVAKIKAVKPAGVEADHHGCFKACRSVKFEAVKSTDIQTGAHASVEAKANIAIHRSASEVSAAAQSAEPKAPQSSEVQASRCTVDRSIFEVSAAGATRPSNDDKFAIPSATTITSYKEEVTRCSDFLRLRQVLRTFEWYKEEFLKTGKSALMRKFCKGFDNTRRVYD